MSTSVSENMNSRRVLDAPIVFQSDMANHDLDDSRFRLIMILSSLFAVFLGIVLIVLTTYMFPQKVDNNTYFIQRAPLAHGKTAAGVTVLASQKSAETQALTRLMEMNRKDHRIVKILGVPGDKITSLDGLLYVNGVNTGVVGKVAKPAKLSISYLTSCVAGCSEGSPELIPTKNIIGETK